MIYIYIYSVYVYIYMYIYIYIYIAGVVIYRYIYLCVCSKRVCQSSIPELSPGGQQDPQLCEQIADPHGSSTTNC